MGRELTLLLEVAGCLALLVCILVVPIVDLFLSVVDGRVDWVHQAELVLLVALTLPVVMLREVLQRFRVHLLLLPELGLFGQVEGRCRGHVPVNWRRLFRRLIIIFDRRLWLSFLQLFHLSSGLGGSFLGLWLDLFRFPDRSWGWR